MRAAGEVAGEVVAGLEVVAMGVVAGVAGEVVVGVGTTIHRIRTRLPVRLAKAAVRSLNGGRARGRVALVAPPLRRVHSDLLLTGPFSLVWGAFFQGGGGDEHLYYVSHFTRRWEPLFYF
jgi:hypothetical protein